MGSFHVIQRSEQPIVFSRDQFTLFELNHLSVEVISLCEHGTGIDEIVERFGLEKTEVESLIQRITKASSEVVVDEKFVGAYLMVSQDCNLRCKYCYADYGAYGKERKMMSREIAKKTIDRLVEINAELEYIQFFGGEPTLNEEIIQYVVAYCKSLLKDGVIQKLPGFTLVTNLVHLTDTFIQLLKKNSFSITVSLDGPEEIHDALRCTFQGEGTYQRVLANYKRLLREGIVPNIEATYTSLHQGTITIFELYEYFHQSFAYGKIFLEAIACHRDHPLAIKDRDLLKAEKEEATAKLMDRLLSDDPIYAGDLNVLLGRLIYRGAGYRHFYHCADAPGICQVAVSATGEIFPCYALLHHPGLEMGQVNSWNRTDFQHAQDKLRMYNKSQSGCADCWAKYLCSICFAGEVMEGIPYGQVQRTKCDIRLSVLEVMLHKVAEIQRDKQKSELFRKNFEKMEVR